ncbi:MAG: hypothetical protein K2O54_05475, partial [Prevotella sp.]|nr:hypothetical protein [Prevotella sp.]
IRELALIICVLVFIKGIVSYAADATVFLYADQKKASSASITVTNDNITVWGSVSSKSEYQVQFIVPDSIYRNAFDKTYAPGTSFSAQDWDMFYASSTNLNLYGNSKDDQKKGCIASGGINK